MHPSFFLVIVVSLLRFAESSSFSTGGTTYVRWGRTTCPSGDLGTQLVYEGIMANDNYAHHGSGANYLCLPKTPIYDKYLDGIQAYATIYGTEYELAGLNPFGTNLHDRDAPCAVCYVPSRGAQLMYPARNDCPAGWTQEYSGYLMAMYSGWPHSSNYVCVDKQAEARSGSAPNLNGGLVYLVQGVCGALPCPPYVQGRELTCSVCTK